MKLTEKSEFSTLISDVLAMFKQSTSPFALTVWWNACQGYELEQVSRALQAHVMDPESGRFAPKVADVVRQLSGTRTDQSALAWGKALDAAGRVGAYSDVVFDDGIIHLCIEDVGGWPKFCRTEHKDLSFLQHRFCEAYRAYAGRGEVAFPPRLNGDRSPDELFAKRGLPPPKPALVGDKDRAMSVLRLGTSEQRGVKNNVLSLAEAHVKRISA